MRRFILRRMINLLPMLLGISLAAFAMMYILPGDPVAMLSPQYADAQLIEQTRTKYNLDASLPEQYASFLCRLARGDMGRSIRTDEPVASTLLNAFFPTAQLAVGALIFAVVFGVSAGVASAAKPRSLVDAGCMLLALTGVSMPVFWLGLMLIIVAGGGTFFAVSGYSPLSFKYLALPCITLGSVTAAVLARLTRSSMLEALGRDYIRTARAKGLAEWRVIIRHGLRSALVPIVTVIGTSLAGLLSGAVLTETVFNIPGLGRQILDAIEGRDYPLVVGAVIVLALIFVIANLIVDILYALLDPRIRYE